MCMGDTEFSRIQQTLQVTDTTGSILFKPPSMIIRPFLRFLHPEITPFPQFLDDIFNFWMISSISG